MVINNVPFLIFARIRVIIAKSEIKRVRYRLLFTLRDRPNCRWKMWLLHCVVGFGCDPCYVCWTKVKMVWVCFWFPPNRENGERHLARTIYPSCDQPHTRYTTKTRGLTFILFVHFTSKIKLITFLNERCRISPLKFEGNFTAHVTEVVRMILNISLPWRKYNKHNSFTQNTSLKRTQITCNLSQRIPAIH
jgi:hypothetical protein